MIRVTFGEHLCYLKDRWSEITLKEFIDLSKLEVPEKLHQLYELGVELASSNKSNEADIAKRWQEVEETIGDEELIKIFPEFYGKAIKILSNITDEALDHMPWAYRAQVYDDVVRPFMLSGYYQNPVDLLGGKIVPYNPPEIKSFSLDDKEYFFPETLTLEDNKVPMAYETALTFSEAADIDLMLRGLSKDGISKFPYFMAIFCREKEEKYSEREVMIKREIFKNVSMDTVWALFFYTDKLLATSLKGIQSSSRAAARKLKKTLVSATGH